MLLESGHRSMVAWNFMFSICFLSISLSIWARIARSRFEEKWEPERPLYTRPNNRSTREAKDEGREDTPNESVARDLLFNQSATRWDATTQVRRVERAAAVSESERESNENRSARTSRKSVPSLYTCSQFPSVYWIPYKSTCSFTF